MIAYLITNKETGKQYVGITRCTMKDRWRRHVGDARRGYRTGIFQRALVKYGAASFTVEEVAEARTWEDLCEIEVALIVQYGTMKPAGYNMTAGGEGIAGYRYDPELVKRIADKQRGKKHTEEARALISAAGKGRVWSEESRAKNSLKHVGKKLTEEHKAKLAAAKLGKKLSPRSAEHSERISAGLRAAWARRKASSHEN